MLDTTRAAPTSTRRHPFKFDDRYREHRVEPLTFMNWLDLGPPPDDKRIKREGRSSLRPNAPRASVPIGLYCMMPCSDIPRASDQSLGLRSPKPYLFCADANPYLVAGATWNPGCASRSRVSCVPSAFPLPSNSTLTSGIWARPPFRMPIAPPASPDCRQHDTERDVLSDYEATTRLLYAPRPRAPQMRQSAGAVVLRRALSSGAATIFSAESPTSVLSARATAGMYDTTAPHAFPRLPPQFQSPYAPLPACAALAVFFVTVFFVAGLALRRLMRRPRFPGLPSTQEHLPHARRPCSTPSASNAPRSYRRAPPTSLRGAATRTSAVRYLPPPFPRLVNLRLAGAWRAPSTVTTRSTGCRRGPSTAPPHRARYHATTSPLHAASDVLGGPRAAFVASPRLATVLSSVPPSPVNTRACRTLQYHLQHVPHPQRAPRSFFVTGAAFVALSYATTIYCLHRSTRAAGRIPPTPTSPAPAAAAFHGARRVRRLPARPGHPQRRPNPSLKTCPWHTSRTPCTSLTHALRPSSAIPHRLLKARSCRAVYHHQRTQHTQLLFPVTQATFVPSPRAPTICSVDPSSPLDSLPAHTSVQSPTPPACAADIPHRPRCAHCIRPPRRSFPSSHRPTPAPTVCSTKTTAAPARGAACAAGVDP
ncbi:hypothetical protein B0H14DRAFT_3865530 [Mycena olivaceomarginata]|nr:hypothetical protein B0H14DRAFT_3865530 [Mycena olivaceomarginata]